MNDKFTIIAVAENSKQAYYVMKNTAETLRRHNVKVVHMSIGNHILRTEHTMVIFANDPRHYILQGINAHAIFGPYHLRRQYIDRLIPGAKHDVLSDLARYICSIEERNKNMTHYDLMNFYNHDRARLVGEGVDTPVRILEIETIMNNPTKIVCEACDSMWTKTNPYMPKKNNLAIKNVIFNPPATIVFWEDGTKTVVQARENDIYDPEKGLMAAITKKALGNQGNYYNTIRKYVEPYMEKNADVESLYPKMPNIPSFGSDFIKIIDVALNSLKESKEDQNV